MSDCWKKYWNLILQDIDEQSQVGRTDGERKHGHRITYTFDTLEKDAKKAGFKIAHRSGIFFKAFANFQWDRILQTDIVSNEYLEGCFELGQQYPDLCASIFLLCKK